VQAIEIAAVVDSRPEDNTTDLLRERVNSTPDDVLFSVPDGDAWQDITALEFERAVIETAKGFIAAGVQPGARIGFICKTKYEWTLVDFALWYAGAVMVPIYETSAPAQIQWILDDSDAVGIILETDEHFTKFDEVQADLPDVQHVWMLQKGALETLRDAGRAITDEDAEERRTRAVGSDMATLIYTSGTTGRPKGCVLTHSNFVELSRNAAVALSDVLANKASTLLFITLAHVFARFISVLCVHGGVRVGHQADTSKLLPTLGSFQPTFLLAVPRVFEKVYNSSEQKAEAGGKGKIFRNAALVAVAHSKAEAQGHVPLGLKLKFKLFDALVYKKLRAALGGRVQYAVSGSAPLSPYLGHFYHSLGIMILEGYGLTETTAPATVNRTTNFKIGTVGPPLPGVSVRIDDDGEILVKGINVFKEYWNNPEATAAAMTTDGYLRTGDLGQLDDDGYLTITGRKKDIIVTAGGKNVAPEGLEDAIRANPLVGQVVVVGDQKPFIAALFTLDPEMLPVWLNNNAEDAGMSIAQAAKNPKVLAEIQKSVDRANSKVSRAESIRKFIVLPTQFTEASGHLTPKLSIKRDVIFRDFALEIESMYGDTESTEGISVNS
jgi:long-chain acyl-CoA synthetase